MLWYPPEVSTLRTRANEQARANQAQGKSANQNSSNLKTISARELLISQGNVSYRSRVAIKTGCESLDQLLQTNLKPGIISVAAENGYGRSILSLYIAIGFLLQHRSCVSIVDTTGGFDVVKALQILQYRSGEGPTANGQPSLRQMAVLDRLQVSRVFDLEGLKQTISELNSHLLHEQQSVESKPGMIIIDNIANVVSAETAKDKIRGYAQLDELCLKFRKTAIEQQFIVLLMNSLARHSTITIVNEQSNMNSVPALGRNFAELLDSSFVLHRFENQSVGLETSLCRYMLIPEDAQPELDDITQVKFSIRDGFKMESLT